MIKVLKLTDYYLANTRRLLGLDNKIKDIDIVEFILPLLYHKILLQEDDIQEVLSGFWKSKSPTNLRSNCGYTLLTNLQLKICQVLCVYQNLKS